MLISRRFFHPTTTLSRHPLIAWYVKANATHGWEGDDIRLMSTDIQRQHRPSLGDLTSTHTPAVGDNTITVVLCL